MFGSDWPVCELAATFDAVVEAASILTRALSPDERSAVFAGTAVTTYRVSADIGAST